MADAMDTISDVALQWSSIVVAGPDAKSFLQGQLSQDLTNLDDDGLWSLLLAPDGIVLTSLHVTPIPDGFALVVPRSLGELALTRLRRFLLRTKCTLELVDVADGPYATTGAQIAAGRPGAAEFALGLTPQCYGASFVAASVSFTKGCFTGQELVGRLDARGSSVPWRMVRATGPNVSRINEVLQSKGPAGTSGVTTSTHEGTLSVALGFAHRSLFGSDELVSASDVSVHEIA
jgi:folate-binding Fe-S cluster repair protein YgfZ